LNRDSERIPRQAEGGTALWCWELQKGQQGKTWKGDKPDNPIKILDIGKNGMLISPTRALVSLMNLYEI
jgi:hypothetical protein